MNVISFSLWGTVPKYLAGAVRNAELAPAIYPGWRCRFYCGASVPVETRGRLAAFAHVDLVERREPGDWTALFWRFEAAADPRVDAAIFRDADSRLNARERAAVDAWLSGRRPFHVMRDHPHHNIAMLGGMWGVRGGVLADVRALADAFPKHDRWQTDQDFLTAVVAPRLGDRVTVHDDYFARSPFPTRRRRREFVGQPFDEHDRPLISGPTDFERRLRRAAKVLYDTAARGPFGLRPR